MDNMEYYKSLISDDEVIKALMNESKAREGELTREKTRVRPNLNFFQRTVTNLVSSNRRIATKPEFVPKESNKYVPKVKTPRTLMREILMTNKIRFVKPEESKGTEGHSTHAAEENRGSPNLNKYLSRNDDPPKTAPKSGSIHFNLNFDKRKFVSTSGVNSEDERHKPCSSSDSSDASIISISSTRSVSSLSSSAESDIISISSDCDVDKPELSKQGIATNTKICKKRCKKKLQKRRKKTKTICK